MSTPRHGLTNKFYTGNPMTDDNGASRVRVDTGRSGFFAGHEFRISYPLSIPAATPVVLKFVSPVDFILQLQSLSADSEGILFQAYRDTQGTEGGTFGTTVPSFRNNFMSDVPDYTQQVAITTGGSFAPDGGQMAVETIRLRVSNATAQESTVSADAAGERGLAAGTYYLKFSNLPASGTALGVYNLIWEERP